MDSSTRSSLDLTRADFILCRSQKNGLERQFRGVDEICATFPGVERGEPPPLSNVSTQDDDMYCRAGGKNAPGSPDYVYCRRDRDAQRNATVVRADKKQRDLGEYMMNNPK